MRDAARRLFTVRPPTRIVQVRVPSIIAGRRGLPVLLSAFAVLAAASTAATTSTAQQAALAAPAGTTMLPPAAPPTYSYPGSAPGGPGTPTPPGGTGLNGVQSNAAIASELAAGGIPARALQAYHAAAAAAGCGIPWTLLAAIGRVESNHGRFAGAKLLADGRSAPPIIGIPLDGRPGVAVIRDTDGGKWDGDTTYDRAVGPMQFIPSSWATFGVDGDGDGKTDPFDIDDAAATAAKYLCKAGGDLSSVANQRNAVYSYNRSTEYVDRVMALSALYGGHAPTDPSLVGDGTPLTQPTLPAGSVGDPLAAPGITTPAGTTPPRGTTPGSGTTTTPPSESPTSPSGPASPSSSSPSSAPATTTPASSSPATQPSGPAPSTTTPSNSSAPPTSPSPSTSPSTSPSPSPSPTCTPTPSASPSPSGTNTPNGVATAAGTATSAASADATSADATSVDATGADPTGTAGADATPTPSPSPTLPPCPS